MTSLPRIFFSLFLIFVSPAGGLSAKSLDIFDTLKPFPPILTIQGDNRYELENLEPDEIPPILKQYETSWKNSKSADEKNLLALATGYLHHKNGDLTAATNLFLKQIVGNFILEDFRIHFLALVLKDRGMEELENKQYPLAVNSFLQTEKLLLKIYKSYPASPFHSDVSRNLAETEHLLGEAHFQTLNFKAAWQAFRRSLMRDFSDSEEHKLKVNLSLARNYQSAGDLQSAADIYASILNTARSVETLEMARNFFRVYENQLKEKEIDIEGLIIDEPAANLAAVKNKKRLPPPKKEKTVYETEPVRNFYASLNQDDPASSLQYGLEILQSYPGRQEARGVTKKLNRIMIEFLSKQPVNEVIDQISSLYPHDTLNRLASTFWKKGLPHKAAYFYEKIIKLYPLQIEACHKTLFFLGRLYEDQGEYAKAVGFYNQLINKYDFGPYTTTALFKIPWIHRLQKNYELAGLHFDRLLRFYSSASYRLLKNAHANSAYQVAALYWLADTQGQLGNHEKKVSLIKELAQKHPFDFYSMFTQDESGFDLKAFLTQNASQEIAFRKFGLGEVDRKRLSRAEKLIAVGFRSHGVQELAQLSLNNDNPAFSYYISHLLKLGGNFQDSIGLSWKIAGKGNHDRLSRSVAEGLFPRAFHKEVIDTMENYDLDPLLVLSLMRQESAFNPKIISRARAVGLMQLMPKTAAEVARSLGQGEPTPENLKDPSTNVRLGIEYLNHLMVSFDQNMVYALAAYNAGPTKVKQWMALRPNLYPLEFIESIPYSETRDYVKKVLRNYAVYLTLYEDQKIDRFKEILTIGYKGSVGCGQC